MCISETWLSPDKLDNVLISGYKIACSYSRSSRTGGGVCILLRDHIDHIELPHITNMSVEYVIEVCACELTLYNIILITMYWNRREEDIFIKQLKQILKYINNKHSKSHVIIGGDFNINLIDNNLKTNQFLDLMREHKFTQHIKAPTRVTPTTSTCLDLIFTNFSDYSFYTTVDELGLSDHSGTIIHLNLTINSNIITWYSKSRKYTLANMKKFKSNISDINWLTILSPDNNLNLNYQRFHSVLTKILNECIPIRKQSLRHRRNNCWLSVGIKVSCRNKRLLKILALKFKHPAITNYYRNYEKILKRTVITAKKIHYKNKIKSSNNKIRTMWNIINERTNKLKKKDYQNIILHLENGLTTEPNKIANYFNDFFSTIGKNITDPTFNPKGVQNTTENSIFLSPIELQEVNSLLKNLKNKKSHGIDEFPPSLFKYCADELTSPVYILMNQSFEEGVFPDLLKQAVIKPIHKKNSKTDASNYRPIALLPTASKIFEKAMCNRIYSFCEKYQIFNECQNGFRKNKSTTLAVYKYIQEALNAINNKQYAIGILIDMTKAYDKVQFKILLEKLYGIGIRGIAHKWLASYLSDRQQLVEIEYHNKATNEIEKVHSNMITINASIPQGSVLGCLLFLIYINDLPKTIKEPCVLFADDISLLVSCKSNEHLNDNLHLTLTYTVDWMTEHNLEVNFSKTKIIPFHPYQKPQININFMFQGLQLDVVNESKLLGLTLDTHINWKSHIKNIRAKLAKFSYALCEVKKTTDLATALSMYYAYAFSCLSYGVILWGNSTDAPTLLTQQKRLIRILANIKQIDSCKPHFQSLKILTLPSIYILEICKFVRKHNENYTTREHLKNKFTLRHKDRLNLPTSKLAIHSSSPLVMSIKIYNKLPEPIRNEKRYGPFVKKLKQFLINKSYYSVKEYFDDVDGTHK